MTIYLQVAMDAFVVEQVLGFTRFDLLKSDAR